MRAPKSVWGQLIALLYSLLSKKKSKEAPHTTSCAEARGAESHTTAAMADNNRNRRFILWFGFSIRIGPAYKDTFLIPENKAYRTHFIGRDSADSGRLPSPPERAAKREAGLDNPAPSCGSARRSDRHRGHSAPKRPAPASFPESVSGKAPVLRTHTVSGKTKKEGVLPCKTPSPVRFRSRNRHYSKW